MDTGNNGVLDLGSFDNKIRNVTAGQDINILNITWDGVTRTASLEIDTSNSDWDPGSDYETTIKSSLHNACETNQGVDVVIPFSTMSAITGLVENDLDGDGDFGDNDTGIYKAMLELDNGTCTLGSDCPLATTGLDGYYAFNDLPAGTYTVHQIDQPGFSSTADSDGGDFNLTTIVIGSSEIASANFLDQANACLPADPVDGYVTSTNPAENQQLVSLATNSITIQFNQPMWTDGGGSVLNLGNYHGNMDNQDLGGDVPYTSIDYDPNSYSVTLTFDTSDPQWLPGTWYEIRIDNAIENGCKVDQGVEVNPEFQTSSSISGQVRLDADGDGDLTDSDAGIPGVTVELDDGVCILGVDCETETTDTNGFYLFRYVIPGTYTIHEINLPGYTSTMDADGTNDDQILVTITPGNISTRNDFLDQLD
jgi:hypothetical protein